jgi:hypothetical protein
LSIEEQGNSEVLIEFRRYIEELNRRAGLASLSPEIDALLASCRIDLCPHQEDGWYASNWAFVSAGPLSRLRSASLRPLEIAEQLLKEARNGDPFSLQLGGSGFLNGAPTREARGSLLQRLDDAEVSLRGRGALFDSSPLWQQEIEVDLNGILEESRRAGFESMLSLSPGQVSDETALMLFVAVKDFEFEISTYLSSAAGRMNLPWFFARLIQAVNEIECAANAGDAIRQFELSAGDKTAVDSLVSLLCRFREARAASPAELHAERILLNLRGIADAFYSANSRPGIRAALVAGRRSWSEDTTLIAFRAAARAVKFLVESVPPSIRFIR